jgi:hypothetical protein
MRGGPAGVGADGEAIVNIMSTLKLSSARKGDAVGVEPASDMGVDVTGFALRGARLGEGVEVEGAGR